MRALTCAVLLTSCASTVSLPPGKPHRIDGFWHAVKPGETLRSIAQRYGAAIDDLEELNGVDRRDSLEVGLSLFVPRGQAARQAAADHQLEQARPGAGSVHLLWPVPGGKLSSGFGKRDGRMHEGIDIAAAEGDPVLAAAAGRVLYAGAGISGYGNLVMIRHAGDLVTIYAHNRRNHVREGQRVRQGEVIAEVGRTGRATGFHLHFEVRQGEHVQDPMRYLKAP